MIRQHVVFRLLILGYLILILSGCDDLLETMAGRPRRPDSPPSDEVFSENRVHDATYVAERLAEGMPLDVQNHSFSNQDYLLHFAVRNNAIETVELLIQSGANIEIRSPATGKTPLFFAAYDNRLDIARLLIANGADVNALDDSENNALREAIVGSHPEMVKLLLEAGTRLDQVGDADETIRDIATKYGSPEVTSVIETFAKKPTL